MADSGFAQLDEMIGKMRALARLSESAAPEVAREVRGSLDATISAGQAPDGTSWAPKKAGGRALANAANAIDVTASATRITVVLTGPEVFHHFGAGGKPRRQVIPQGDMPPLMGVAVRRGYVTGFGRVMGDGG